MHNEQEFEKMINNSQELAEKLMKALDSESFSMEEFFYANSCLVSTIFLMQRDKGTKVN